MKTDLSCSAQRAVLLAALSLTFVDRFIYFCICVASNIHFPPAHPWSYCPLIRTGCHMNVSARRATGCFAIALVLDLCLLCVLENTMHAVYAFAHQQPCAQHTVVTRLIHWLRNNTQCTERTTGTPQSRNSSITTVFAHVVRRHACSAHPSPLHGHLFFVCFLCVWLGGCAGPPADPNIEFERIDCVHVARAQDDAIKLTCRDTLDSPSRKP